MTCGIYILKFNGTHKVYVGMSDNIENRWSGHKYNLVEGSCSYKLKEAYKKYGMPTLEVICECEKSELDALEREAIQIYNSIEDGFNSRDGGVTGAGISVSGDGNGMSRYNNSQIENAFVLLTTTALTHKEIADTVGISIQAVSHISCGTGHKWLTTKYPEEYAKLVNTKRPIHKAFASIVIVDTTTTIEHVVGSYKEIQELTGCAYTSAVSLIAGRLSHLFNRWKLKNAKQVSTLPKKKRYTLKNTSTGLAVEVYSKLKFFTEYALINKKKFSDFLSAAIIGSEYQGWELVSVS